jgi:alkylglycerol monooxygenase
MLNTFALLIPAFLLIVLFEWYISNKKQNNRYTVGNTMMNITIGAIDQIGSLFYFTLLYFVLKYVSENYKLIEINNIWAEWILAYIAVDFLSYWYHRFSHRINFLWAGHITHHSSELFNLSNGFRTSLFQGINRIVFWAFLPLFGFSPLTLVVILKVSGIYDFFVHTEYGPKVSFLEKVFITPSLHKVHHGKNDIYLDKNYGSTFSIWDRLFGTFQEETEKVSFGVTGNYVDNNPIWAIGYYYNSLWNTSKSAKKWSDKIKVWFMPPEWKPQDLKVEPQSSLKEKDDSTIFLRKYAQFQISISVVGIIVLLVTKDFLSNWEFILSTGICIISMTNVTLIYKNNIKEGYEKREIRRLIIATSLIVFTMLWYSNFYLSIIAVFLLTSIAIISGYQMQANTKDMKVSFKVENRI